MIRSVLNLNGRELPVIALDTAVVGSGCAGFAAADWLCDYGRRDIAMLTEGVDWGTSRNAGSDKQTYYKLSLASDGADSVAALAADLFAGGGVNGDTAYAEAAGSARAFIKLANLGVEFPTNEYGEYVGYKTDHDPRRRATSAGPLTSKRMTEALERSVRARGVPILDGLLAVELIIEGSAVRGLICLDTKALDNGSFGLTLICAGSVILATGGPAGVYQNRVYPESQTGMSGMALRAGARAANLQEWQYGLASVGFRWNVSGTYQQALPRYISVDEYGDVREFLPGYFGSPRKALDMVFLKGYQWPFDAKKADGSSAVDLCVHHEIFDLKRRVYLDYRTDPAGLEDGFGALEPKAGKYLANSGALCPTPLARLAAMNAPAVALYRAHGIDLTAEPLQISVCAQHHNGGLAVDAHWRTSIGGLYAAGECAGTFGAYRPGGSALNSGQVGAQRAAEHIAGRPKPDVARSLDAFAHCAGASAGFWLASLDGALRNPQGPRDYARFAREMSAGASYVRDVGAMKSLAAAIQGELDGFFERASARDVSDLPGLARARDTMVTQLAVLSAMIQSAEAAGSRGAALVLSESGEPVCPALPALRVVPEKATAENLLLTTRNIGGEEQRFESFFEPVRPLPKPDDWFESVWKAYQRRMEGLKR